MFAHVLLRCARTYQNYLGYVRTGCLLLDVPDTVFETGKSSLRRAAVGCSVHRGRTPLGPLWWPFAPQASIQKGLRWVPRPRMYINLQMVRAMLVVSMRASCTCPVAHAYLAWLQHLLTEPEWTYTAMWAMTSYVFMLRCGSHGTQVRMFDLPARTAQVAIRVLAHLGRQWGTPHWACTEEACRDSH